MGPLIFEQDIVFLHRCILYQNVFLSHAQIQYVSSDILVVWLYIDID